jgi:hypothetical protein
MAEKEYIERDKLGICKCNPEVFEDKGYAKGWNAAIDIIQSAPAADVRPVVRARWQHKTMTVPGGKGQTYAKWCCTACKGKVKERTNFCPICGAMMEES